MVSITVASYHAHSCAHHSPQAPLALLSRCTQVVDPLQQTALPDVPKQIAYPSLLPRAMGVPASQIQLPPVWISLWFGISSIIVLWDAAYCFYRPRSLSGGDLSWIWWPYDKMNYGTADYMYGWFAFDLKDGFTNGQGEPMFVPAAPVVSDASSVYERD